VLDKIVASGEGQKKYPARQCQVWTAHMKWSETRHFCKFCIVPLHRGSCFEKYYSETDYVYAVSSVLDSGISSKQSNCK
jgi:tRNA A37 methylthiotransferase MiaB